MVFIIIEFLNLIFICLLKIIVKLISYFVIKIRIILTLVIPVLLFSLNTLWSIVCICTYRALPRLKPTDLHR